MQTKIKHLASFLAIMLFFTCSMSAYAQVSRFSIALNSLTTNFNFGSSNAESILP